MASINKLNKNVDQAHSNNYNNDRTARKVRRKKASRQTYTSFLILCTAVVIVIALVLGYQSLLGKEKAYQENIEELNNELDHLEETNNQLKNEMNNMDSKEFKEKIAREKLGMIGQDEVLIKESTDGTVGRGTDEHEDTTESSEEGEEYNEEDSDQGNTDYSEEDYSEENYNEEDYNEEQYDESGDQESDYDYEEENYDSSDYSEEEY